MEAAEKCTWQGMMPCKFAGQRHLSGCIFYQRPPFAVTTALHCTTLHLISPNKHPAPASKHPNTSSRFQRSHPSAEHDTDINTDLDIDTDTEIPRVLLPLRAKHLDTVYAVYSPASLP